MTRQVLFGTPLKMDWEETQRLAIGVAANTRAPEHEPMLDSMEGMPCEEEARIITKLISKIDTGALDLRFGGCGDSGEYLIGILDVLLEAKIITLNLDVAKEIASRGAS